MLRGTAKLASWRAPVRLAELPLVDRADLSSSSNSSRRWVAGLSVPCEYAYKEGSNALPRRANRGETRSRSDAGP